MRRRRRRIANTVYQLAGDVLYLLMEDGSQCFRIAEKVATQSAEVAWEIVGDFILSSPTQWEVEGVVERRGNYYELTPLGEEVVEKAGNSLTQKVHKVKEDLQSWW